MSNVRLSARGAFTFQSLNCQFPCSEWDINEKNTIENAWQRKSENFDFTKEDRIPDREFTEVIWKAVKGENAMVPAPKRAAFVKQNEKKDDDD